MRMRTIIARPKGGEEVRKEFLRFLDLAASEGWTELEVSFGYAWTCELPGAASLGQRMTPAKLAETVASAEAGNQGRVGEDDLTVTPLTLGVTHLFCHEADIHLEGPEDSAYLESEAERFFAMGWTVHEALKSSEDPHYRKVRDYKPRG